MSKFTPPVTQSLGPNSKERAAERLAAVEASLRKDPTPLEDAISTADAVSELLEMKERLKGSRRVSE